MKKTIFLTGASGFIGRALTDVLKDEYVIVPLEGDLLDYPAVKAQLGVVNPNFIIHLAARTEVEKSFYDPSSFSSVNYVGTVNMIEAARTLPNLELFVFSSTMETYGWQPTENWFPFTEETPQHPSAPYAVAKLACEFYLQYARRYFNFPYTILRQTNAYGRTDNDFFVVEQFITQMLKNPSKVSFGNREPYRNFLYISDLVDLYKTILHNADLARGEVFCTGPNNALRIEDLADLIAAQIGWSGEITWGTKPERPGEIYYLNSSSDKARRVLGWEPKVPLITGLNKTIAHWKGVLNETHGTESTN